MPIKYVGRTTDFSGKTLWEILGNLNNFGVGRLVKRQMFDRYPEPSFFRIAKVEAVDVEPEVNRRVRAWVEKVFRGRKYPKLIELHRVSYKADYRLIPKSEEKKLWDKVNNISQEIKCLSPTKSFPPLLADIIKDEMRAKGLPVTEPALKIKIKKGRDNFYRIAGEDETSAVKLVDLSERRQFDLKK